MRRAEESGAVVFKIHGRVVEEGTQAPLPGLFVKAYDEDLLFDDVLGSAHTDDDGRFEIVTELRDFREFFERRPDVYFKVFGNDRRTLLHKTGVGVRWRAGTVAEAVVEIPWDMASPPGRAKVTLTGDDGAGADAIEVGDSLAIRAAGLRPRRTYDITVASRGKRLFTSRLITNLRGEIESTVLWPQMGLDDPATTDRLTVDAALERWQDQPLDVTLAIERQTIATASIRIAKASDRPLVLATDAQGRIANGFEQGAQPLFLSVRNVRADGPVRVFLVPRQQDWRVGDSIAPATLASGKPAVRDIELPSGGRQATIELAGAADVRPGAYDFILRPLRYGAEENDAMRLLPTDIVGSRRVTGVVVRERFLSAKPVLGGCVNKIPISCRSITGAPYLRYSDTFAVGENVYAAIDPGIVDPNNLGKMCALYVIPSRDDAAWSADNSLNHLSVLGGNAAAPRIKLQAYCVNANKLLLWPGASLPGSYDIVADFGNNTPDAASFDPDHEYNTPLDMIDGYFLAGFRVVRDPGTLQEFANAGNWNYVETDVEALGMAGTVVVEDEATAYASPPHVAVNRTVRLKANVYFPADAPGATGPSMIAGAGTGATYPLVVIVHGNGHNYTSYDFLLQHLARNGFIAASIDCRYIDGGPPQHGMHGLGRANVLFRHLLVLQTAFATHVQNNIGIMGHSRGGEGVLKAARLNQQLALGHNFNGIISLAPTDQYGTEVLGGSWAKPFLVLYGSRDGDVAGWPPYAGYTVQQTGFSLYDRAKDAPKSMAFVYRASHNGFITTNYDAFGDSPIPEAQQRAVTLAYVNAFFRRRLKNETEWDGVGNGEWIPPSVQAQPDVELHMQHRAAGTTPLDDFEGAVPDWQSSTIGGTVTDEGSLPASPQEAKMYSATGSPGLDNRSPHDTKGLLVRWDHAGDRLVFKLPPGSQDLTGFEYLSFRITQREASPHNPVNAPQNLRVALKDAANNERAVRVGAFGTIPYPDQRANATLRKSAMRTIRIPLKSYRIVCAGMPQVDLANVTTVALRFTEVPTGEIEIDELEFVP